MNLIDRLRAGIRIAARAPVAFAIKRMERWRKFRHELGVCAIFREEAPFLDEWLTFHCGVGVTHFYLYNNFSTDNFRTVLEPWIDRGVVTLIDWPVPVGQTSAYEDCVKRARHECRWLAFLDIDEFLFSPRQIDIREILSRYTDLPGLVVWQLFFGSGGNVSRPSVAITEAYLRRALPSQFGGKTIANPRLVYKVGVHQCKYWQGVDRDTSRRPIPTFVAGAKLAHKPVFDVLRINHYWSRSLDDLATKIARQDASSAKPRDARKHFDFEKTLNAETDETILPIARAIRSQHRSPEGVPQ